MRLAWKNCISFRRVEDIKVTYSDLMKEVMRVYDNKQGKEKQSIKIDTMPLKHGVNDLYNLLSEVSKASGESNFDVLRQLNDKLCSLYHQVRITLHIIIFELHVNDLNFI
jgi:hypothetical protein